MHSKMLSYHRLVMEICRLKVDNINVSFCGEEILQTLTRFGWCVFSTTFIITDMACIGQTALNDSFCMWKINFPMWKTTILMLSKWELGSLSFFPSKGGDGQFSPSALIDPCLAHWCAYIGDPEVRTSSKHFEFWMALQHFHSLRRGVWCQS